MLNKEICKKCCLHYWNQSYRHSDKLFNTQFEHQWNNDKIVFCNPSIKWLPINLTLDKLNHYINFNTQCPYALEHILSSQNPEE